MLLLCSIKKQITMKKVILIALVLVVTLSSCSLETFQCHSYGHTNHHTKHGVKAQDKFAKKHRI
jgi:PBP1b-binding outer membrane lipoprotein LpoB